MLFTAITFFYLAQTTKSRDKTTFKIGTSSWVVVGLEPWRRVERKFDLRMSCRLSESRRDKQESLLAWRLVPGPCLSAWC